MSRKLQVLVVEDEFLVADFIAGILEDAGHTVVGIAPTGAAALSILEERAADIALVDIKLKGGMDGVELAVELRRRGVRHLFISGSGDPSTLARAQATEPLAFLQKPFNKVVLLKLLDQAPLFA